MSHPSGQTKLALKLKKLSIEQWGEEKAVILLGRHERFREAQKRLLQFSKLDRPILITGESGVGKELFAQSLYLLCARKGKPFLSVNCAQYQGEDLLASELFGHKKGSFTGASSDRKGLFEEARGGVIFLDEVGELSPKAQAMLLRAVSEQEIVRVGESRARSINTRVVAATNRDVQHMARIGSFRVDLFYRLCYLRLSIPPLRERGEDWRMIAGNYLANLNREHEAVKRFSESAVELLSHYRWPGNVRELKSIIDMAYCLSSDPYIKPEHFGSGLESALRLEKIHRPTSNGDDVGVLGYYYIMEGGEGDFWKTIRRPYLDRELNRSQVRRVIEKGLRETNGSYKRLLDIFCISQDDYLKFMDFLRHHRLKPEKVEMWT